jgi:adenylate cyclase
LTEVHGDEEAVRLVEGYCESMRAIFPAHAAEEVKAIGDALLVRVPDPCDAVKLGIQVTREVGAQHGFPAVRVGMHHGPAIRRGDDYFGHTINIAARVTALAGAGEVLVTETIASAAQAIDSVHLIERGSHTLKGIEAPVHIYLAATEPEETAHGLPIDPVCRMAVDPDRAGGMLVHEGRRYHFCSMHCAGRFAEAPTRFV